MSTESQRIIHTINTINSVEDERQLDTLDEAIQLLFNTPHPELGMDALLGIFERFPEKDGYGLFWSILHGLENLPNYEEKLIKSVRRNPSWFSLNMINRILNSGQREVNGVDLLEVLEEIAGNPQSPASIRERATRQIEWQQSCP